MTAVDVQTKRCNRCGKDKPLDDFYHYKSGTRAGRPYSECKSCSSERAVAWKIANRARHAANIRAWRAEHPDYVARGRAQTEAYAAALSRLRDRHRTEFEALYDDELRKRGLR